MSTEKSLVEFLPVWIRDRFYCLFFISIAWKNGRLSNKLDAILKIEVRFVSTESLNISTSGAGKAAPPYPPSTPLPGCKHNIQH